MQQASSIRGLAIRRQIPCRVYDRDKVKQYLLQTIAKKLPPRRLKMEGLVYKALGLIPPSFNYEHAIVDFYLSQIGGYYDPENKHFVMAGWMPVILQTTVAVHELTHGLQDQHYDLDKFVDMRLQNSDMLLARSALVEGDATCVMLDYMRKLTGQNPLAGEQNVESFMMQNIIGASLMGGESGVPESVRLIMIFPYTSGVRFAHGLLVKGGYGQIGRAFAAPPASTEEILHFEKYAAGTKDFISLATEDLRAAIPDAGADILFEDTLGEFVISVMLGLDEKDRRAATQAAAGWGGDRIAVFGNEAAKTLRLVWKSSWDSEEDAREFYNLLFRNLKIRFGRMIENEEKGDINLGFDGPRSVVFSCRIDESAQTCVSTDSD